MQEAQCEFEAGQGPIAHCKIWLYHKLAIKQDEQVIKTSRHVIKVCETVIKEHRNLLYYWLCHTI